MEGGRNAVLRVAAPGQQGAHQVTGAQTGSLHCQRVAGDNGSGYFQPWQGRGPWWRRIMPLALHHIRAVHARSGHAD